MICLLRPPKGDEERGCGTRQCDSDGKTESEADNDSASANVGPAERGSCTGAFVRLVVDNRCGTHRDSTASATVCTELCAPGVSYVC
jgi:hypothetical protein